MHTAVTSGGEELSLKLYYDDHYCRDFEKRPSKWQLLVADWLAEKLPQSKITVDGKVAVEKPDFSQQVIINIPAGLGTHTIEIE